MSGVLGKIHRSEPSSPAPVFRLSKHSLVQKGAFEARRDFDLHELGAATLQSHAN